MSAPPVFPLKEVVAKYELKLTNSNEKLSELWLQKEYQKISQRESRKRVRNGESNQEDEYNESNDDMIISDSDNTITQLSYHAPKRRLMSFLSPVNNTWENEDGTNDDNGSSVHTILLDDEKQEVPGSVSMDTSSNDNELVGVVAHSANSISDTPVSDFDEQPQQLPLPSPSASPIHSASKQDLTDPIDAILSNVPSTQSDMIELIKKLSIFLTETNQNHLTFQLLQNINRSALSSIGDVINNSLKRDLLSNLPTEITRNILSHLDYKSLFNISLVCTNWYKIINNSDVWIELLQKDHLMDNIEEIEREIENPAQLIKEWADTSSSSDINIAQLLYKKRFTIYNRWMDPKYVPKRISINVPSQGNNVVTCVQHDDEKIITGVDDRLINIYDTKTGALLKVLKGHEGGVWALKYTGNTLISGSTDRTVRIWNIKTGKCTHIFKGHTSTVRCLDILHPVKIGVDDSGNDIIFPHETLLVTGSRDHNLIVWRLPLASEDDEDTDPEQENPVTYESTDIHNPFLLKVLIGHNQSVRSVSAYGNLIVSGSYDTTVRVWDLLQNANCVQVLAGHTDRIYSTVLDFHKKICYSGSMDSTINIWNVETGALLHSLEGHGSLVGLLELSDNYLVSAAADSTLRVWNPDTGENYSKLEGHSAAITCFQHDALRIVSGSERMLKLWDIRKGKFVKDLLADVTGGIWQVSFDFNRCISAVQRTINDREETFIELLDFSTPLNQ